MIDAETINRKINALGIKFINGKPNLDHLYKVTLTNTVGTEAKEWCESYFKNKWIWGTPIGGNTTTFYFSAEEDLLFFKMRYSGFLIT